MNIKTVLKNNSKTENFDWKKIESSVVLAGRDTKAYGKTKAKPILTQIKRSLPKNGATEISSQEIRNIVEPVIAKAGYFETARYYILYKERKEQKKKARFQPAHPKISKIGLEVAQKRYFQTDMSGKLVENLGGLFQRVAKHMAKAEINWSTNGEVESTAHAFYERMANWKFVCSGKAMFEAGNPGGTGQMSACFVLPIEDSIPSIFKTLGDAAYIHKNNGGTGFNFSKIRPKGDKVKNVPNAASGPVDFIKAYSAALAQILQGSKRQGANIAILNVDHPDIIDFIHLKDNDGTIKNFNISVGITNEFIEAVEKNQNWDLINPRNNEVVKSIKAADLFNLITEHAWLSGDPGLAFLDRIEEDNPTPSIGAINATNPCGEIPLHPYESCNLASICLQNHLKTKDKAQEIDWEDLEHTVRLGVRFLDNMIEMNTYALKEIEEMVKNGNRRIGLGVMGFGHLLFKLKIPYNSQEAVRLAERLAKFIQKTSESESIELAKVRGTFPNFDRSVYTGTAEKYRNAALTTVAPTGTISLIAGTTSGIEPAFSVVVKRMAFNEDNDENKPTKEFLITDPEFEAELKKLNLKKDNITLNTKPLKSYANILKAVAEHGLNKVKGLPSWYYKVFVTSHDIEPKWHVKIQAAWQKWFDNSISKTVNFSNTATVDDVKTAYLLAAKTGCKGITIYRDGSKVDQVLNTTKKTKPQNSQPTKCSECEGDLIHENGCSTCTSCGWSKCTI